MNKKLYKQPQTDFVRMNNGYPVMTPIGQGIAGSPTGGQPGTAPLR